MAEPITTAAVLANLSKASSIASAVSGIFGKGGTSWKDVVAGDRYKKKVEEKRARDLPAHQVKGWLNAGIHPLAGIGLNPASGGIPYNSLTKEPKQNNWEKAAQLGQNLSRAQAANVSGAYEKQMQQLSLERASLENDLLKTQIADIQSPGSPPKVVVKPSETTATKSTGREAAEIPATGTMINVDGTKTVIPSEKAKERLEDNLILETEWLLKNRLNPAIRKAYNFKYGVPIPKSIIKQLKRMKDADFRKFMKRYYQTPNWRK